VSPWRPIATAPKDISTDILVYAPRHGVFIACFVYGWIRTSSGRATPHDDFFGDGDLGITHWMPLPEAP
jgi:hypothetical protein